MNIIETSLSVRAKNVLQSQGIDTVESLLLFYQQGIDMSSIRNMGAKSLKEIRDFCSTYDENDPIASEAFSKLNLNQRIKDALILKGIYHIRTLKYLSESELNRMSELTLRDRLILKTIKQTLEVFPDPKKTAKRVQIDDHDEDFNTDNILKQQFDFFLKEIPSDTTYRFLHPYYLDCKKGHISELEFLFKGLKIYAKTRFDSRFGLTISTDKINVLKSNNQLILLFLQKKLRGYTRNLEITKEEALILMQSLHSENDQWLLSRLLGLTDLSSLLILDNYYIVDRENHSTYLKTLRSVEGLPKKKRVKLTVPKLVAADSSFMRLLQISFPILIHESGYLTNYVSEIPVLEKIYARLNESGKPISFDHLWLLEEVKESSQSGIRIKMMRDSRFIIYGKLGYIGLVDWGFSIDEVMSGSIPETTISLIKIYNLSGLNFGSLSKIYSRLGKNLKLSSWKNNLLLSRNDVTVSNNTARTIVDHSDLASQIEFLNSLNDNLQNLLNGQTLTGHEAMELALQVALIDFRNFHAITASQIDDLLSLIRSNVKELGKALHRTTDRVDYNFLEVCFGFKISRMNKTNLVLGVFTEMIEDGEITHEEKEVIDKWIDEGELSTVQVKQTLSQGIMNGSLLIDKQIAYILQYRGVKRLSEKILLEDLKYLLFDIQNIQGYIDRSKGFTLEDGFYTDNMPETELSKFTLKVVGQEFLLKLKKSLWDNATFEYSEETNGPAITVNSNSKVKYVSLIEDSIISYLLMENLMDPSSITKIRKRVNLKLKSQYHELFE